MGDHHDRAAAVRCDDREQLVLQARAGQRVERAERLVHQQHLRLHRQRAGDADALLHAAGDLARALVRRRRQADQRERRVGARLQLGAALGRAEHALDAEVDVLEAGQPRQQRMVLEHDGALRAGPGDLAVGAQQHAVRRPGQPGDQVQQGRLAAARVADQRDELALRDAQVDVAQRLEAALRRLEGLLDVGDVDELGRRSTGRRRSCLRDLSRT